MSSHKIMRTVLWQALDDKRQDLGLSWREVARQTDLAPSTFSRLKTAGVHSDALVSMLVWLGTDNRYFTVRS